MLLNRPQELSAQAVYAVGPICLWDFSTIVLVYEVNILAVERVFRRTPFLLIQCKILSKIYHHTYLLHWKIIFAHWNSMDAVSPVFTAVVVYVE